MTHRLARAVGLAAALGALSACDGPAVGSATTRALDVVDYGAHVHGVLEPSCATLDCHGDPGRPLRLYGETGLRLTDALRGEPVTDEELALDVAALAGLDAATPAERSLVLLKPLAERAGGLHHVGRDVWLSRDEDAYRCVAAWLAGTLDDAGRATCDRAAAAVALPPEDP